MTKGQRKRSRERHEAQMRYAAALATFDNATLLVSRMAKLADTMEPAAAGFIQDTFRDVQAEARRQFVAADNAAAKAYK